MLCVVAPCDHTWRHDTCGRACVRLQDDDGVLLATEGGVPRIAKACAPHVMRLLCGDNAAMSTRYFGASLSGDKGGWAVLCQPVQGGGAQAKAKPQAGQAAKPPSASAKRRADEPSPSGTAKRRAERAVVPGVSGSVVHRRRMHAMFASAVLTVR